MAIQVAPGLETGLNETQRNVFEVLISLPVERFNQVKDFLELDVPNTLGTTTITTFASRAAQEGIDLSDAGVNAFKEANGLGNNGPLRGVIGPQTAEKVVARMMAQDVHIPVQRGRNISQDGIDLVKEFEGLHATIPGKPGFVKAYLDPINIPTIGYGHTKGVTMGMVVSEKEAEDLLRQDLDGAEEDVERLVKVPLTAHQFDALVSFAFNCGSGSLASSTLLRKLNAKDYAGAADEFLKWVNAGGKPFEGLKRRRAGERKLFLTP